jgi:hypothetical protein
VISTAKPQLPLTSANAVLIKSTALAATIINLRIMLFPYHRGDVAKKLVMPTVGEKVTELMPA